MIPNEIIKSEKLDSYEKLTILIIAMFLPNSFPSVETISELAGICKRKVRSSIKKLRFKNVIIVQERPGYSSIYIPYWVVDKSDIRVDNSITPLSYSADPPLLKVQGYPCPIVQPNNTPLNKTYLTRDEKHDFQSAHKEAKDRIRKMVKLKGIPE